MIYIESYKISMGIYFSAIDVYREYSEIKSQGIKAIVQYIIF